MKHDGIIAQEASRICQYMPDASNQDQGAALYDRLTSVGDPAFDHWLTSVQLQACGRQCADAMRALLPSMTHDGKALSPSAFLKVRSTDDEGQTVTQMKLWRTCTPAAFIDAVQREQHVVEGRLKSNSARLEIVGLLHLNADLMAEPTVEDAVRAAGLNPDDYFLDEAIGE